MFSKPKITDPIEPVRPTPAVTSAPPAGAPGVESAQPKAKPAPSTISSDLTVVGNVHTTGDMQVDGKIEGDIRAHMLTVGENAVISGEIVADDVGRPSRRPRDPRRRRAGRRAIRAFFFCCFFFFFFCFFDERQRRGNHIDRIAHIFLLQIHGLIRLLIERI
jgi:hypothetical protein